MRIVFVQFSHESIPWRWCVNTEHIVLTSKCLDLFVIYKRTLCRWFLQMFWSNSCLQRIAMQACSAVIFRLYCAHLWFLYFTLFYLTKEESSPHTLRCTSYFRERTSGRYLALLFSFTEHESRQITRCLTFMLLVPIIWRVQYFNALS